MRVVVVALVVALAAAPEAAAERFAAPRIGDGPVFVGSGVAWEHQTRTHGVTIERATARGARRATLLRREPPGNEDYYGSVLGSSDGVAAQVLTYDRYDPTSSSSTCTPARARGRSRA